MMLQGKARTLAFYQAATGKDAQDHIAADHGLADFQVYEFPADDDDPYQEQAESDYAAIFDFDVEREAHKIRVREAAREIVEASKRPPAEPFDAGTLAEILARPPEPAARVEGLIPWEAGTELVAQRKTGKTTLLLNLARSLFTGEEFLGKFGVRPIDGEIAFLNFEVSGAQLARWATDVGISPDQFYIVNLRGRRNPFSNTEDRQRLAATLKTRGTEAILCDPFSRAYAGQSQNDPGEVGAWLIGLDQFARAEVGARDVVLSAHAGWNGERTRGASALEDWADSIITMTKDDSEDGTGVPPRHRPRRRPRRDRLDYDPRTRTLAGTGSRKAAAKKRRAEKNAETLREEILTLVAKKPRLNGSEVERELREAGVSFQRGEHRSVLQALVDGGKLTVEPGKKNAKLYQLAQIAQASPELAHGPGSELAQPAYIEGGLANTNTGPTDTPPDSGLGQLMDPLGGEVIEEADT
jgi:AAA domain